MKLESKAQFQKNVKEGTRLKRVFSMVGLPLEEVIVSRVRSNHIDFTGGEGKKSCLYYSDKTMGKVVVEDGLLHCIWRDGQRAASFEVLSF